MKQTKYQYPYACTDYCGFIIICGIPVFLSYFVGVGEPQI